MTAVAVCNDSPQVPDGTALAGCTAVVFVDSSELSSGFFAGFTPDVALTCAGAVIGLWALAWCVAQLVRLVRTSRI
jgi:hypothetical protein